VGLPELALRAGRASAEGNVTVRVEHGDCLEVIPRLVAEGVVVDAVVTDPPYHLTSTLKRFGKIDINDDTKTSQRLRQKLDGAARLAHGFMNQQWDGGDVAFRPETWATVASILRPGGFLLAFGGTRTFHRVWCAIEDAGLVLQDTVMWMYGSGFPKRRDALKPAWEPICVAYKPGGKRTLQVDECRVEGAAGNGVWGTSNETILLEDGRRTFNASPGAREYRTKPYRIKRLNPGASVNKTGEWKNQDREFEGEGGKVGRWPANVCHDGSDEVIESFARFGDRTSGTLLPSHDAKPSSNRSMNGGNYTGRIHAEFGGDSGSIARFFYSGKAGDWDRRGSTHPTVKPVELMQWLVPLVCPRGGTVLDPFAGSGTTGDAARIEGRNAILIEREPKYVADIERRLAIPAMTKLF
jgi:site-specific DNA-methyltransferase (adenine-specific)